jgi:hypothetical protein
VDVCLLSPGVVTPSSLVGGYQPFRQKYCHHLQDRSEQGVEIGVASLMNEWGESRWVQ